MPPSSIDIEARNMDGSTYSTTRNQRGQFVPGQSGNPAGKRPGTRNRATLLAAALAEGEAEAAARVVIDKALAGNVMAARFLVERLSPKPRGRAIMLELPEGESAAGDVVAMFNSALRAMAAGQITPDEAVTVSRFLEGRCRVLRAWQTERKVTGYGNGVPVPGDDWVPDEEAAEGDEVPAAAEAPDPPADPSTVTGPAQDEGSLRAGARSPGADEESRAMAALLSPRPERAGGAGFSKDPAAVPADPKHPIRPASPRSPLHSSCISEEPPRPPTEPFLGLAPTPAAYAPRC
jgi:hypothetical protein